jgi:hypothetical protein
MNKKGNAYETLPSTVLMLLVVAMLIGVGILMTEKFGDAVGTDTTVTAEVVTFTGETASLANGVIQSISSAVNNTASGETVTVNILEGTAGTVSTTSTGLASANVTYIYKADSYTTDRMDNVTDALDDISNDWLSLIITMIILSLIIGMVVFSFSGRLLDR